MKGRSFMKWKKIIIVYLALVGSFSVALAMNIGLYAENTTTFALSNTATGRVNRAPAGITSSSIGIKKGDKFYLQAKNPMDQKPLGWINLGYEADDGINTDYWVAATTEPIAKTKANATSPTYQSLYKKSLIYPEIQKLNSEMHANTIDDGMLMPRPMINIDKINSFSNYWNDQNFKISSMSSSGYDMGKTPYTLSVHYDTWWQSSVSGVGILRSAGNVKARDIDFSEAYWQGIQEGDSAQSGGNAGQWKIIAANGVDRSFVPYNEIHAVRAAAALKLSDVVFGIAMDDGSSSSNLSEIRSFTLPATYTGLYQEAATYGIMKLRMYNQADPLTVTLTDVVDTFGKSITDIEKNGTLFIKAKAENKNSAVSVLIFKDGVFQYYKILDSAKGDDQAYYYEFDTTGIPTGTYQISIVNEVISTDQAPVYSSDLSETKTINILNQTELSTLTYTKAHISGSDLTDIYKATSNGNTKQNDILGHLSGKNGMGNPNQISYVLLDDSSHSGDYQKLEIPLDDTTNYPFTDTNQPYVKVKTANGLSSGVYKFRVQAYDANGNPYPAIDETGNHITDTSILNDAKKVNESLHYIDNDITKDQSHGIISNDLEFVVYPHESQVSYEQLKNASGEYYKTDDVNNSAFNNHLGRIVFGTDEDAHANMQALADDGYRINTASSKLMKKGSTTEQYTYFKISSDPAKTYQFYIDKANNNVTSGDHEFDAWLYFKNAGGDTALLKLTNQNLYIAPSLSFVNPDKQTEFLTTNTYERKYNAYPSASNIENTFTLIATDKTDHSANTKVSYCLLNETTNTCEATNDNDIATMSDHGNGTLTIIAKQFHEQDPDIKIRAQIKDASNTVVSYTDLLVKIKRAERKLTWEATNYSSLKSTVTKKNDNYELKLPYDASTSVEYTYEKIANMRDSLAAGKLALRHDAGKGNLSITLHGNISAGNTTDSFQLTDVCTGTACYIEVTKPQDDLFEAKTVKLYIVTEDMQELNDDQISWLFSEDQTVWKGTGTTFTLDYVEHGSYPVKINADILPADLTGLKILYTLEDQDHVGTITIANAAGSDTEAELGVLKANQTASNAKIKAVISSDNYAQKTVYLPVHINKCNQTIGFNDSFKELGTSIKLDTNATYDYSAVLKVDNATLGKGTIAYTISGTPVDMISDDASNKSFTVSKPGTVSISASVSDDQNYHTTTTDKKVTKTITFYDDAGLTWTQGTQTEAISTVLGTSTGNAQASMVLGDIKIDGGKDTSYTFSIDNTKHSDDSTFFTIEKDATNKAGKLKLLKAVDAMALSTHSLQDGDSDTYEWTIHVKATGVKDTTDLAQGDITVKFTGAEPYITFTNADANKKIIKTYEPQGRIDFNVKRGDASIGDATLSLSGYSGTIDIDAKEIKSANTDNAGNVRSGRKTEITASVRASAGYKQGTSVSHEIIINKAEHPEIDFTNKTLSSSNNVEVLIDGILHSGGKADESVSITPIKVEESDPWLIDEFTMTKDQAYETPAIAVSPKGYIGIVEFQVAASGDDNYKPLPDQTKLILEFTEAGGIIYRPIELTYGDQTHHVLDYITSPNPSEDAPTVHYTYTPADTNILTISDDGTIIPVHTGKTTLTLKRVDSADFSEMEQTLHVTIKPKEVIIQPKDIHKKVGELLTNDEYELDFTKSGTFEAGDELGALVFSCQDDNVEVTSFTDGVRGPKELNIMPFIQVEMQFTSRIIQSYINLEHCMSHKIKAWRAG